MKAAAWIDRVKAARGWESDYRVAKELATTRQAISDYRTRTATMDEDMAVKVANTLSIDPAIILTDQAMERAKNTEARSAWSAVLERLGGVAVSIFLTAGLGWSMLASPDVQARDSYNNNSNPTVNCLYIV